jgi:hypothetical protein
MRVVQIGVRGGDLSEDILAGRARSILARWDTYLPYFWKVAPHLALTEEGPRPSSTATSKASAWLPPGCNLVPVVGRVHGR